MPTEAPVAALSFVSPLSLAAIKACLDTGTPWVWREGDNAYFDYLAARVGPGDRALRVYPDGRRYVVEARYGRIDADLKARLIADILPLLDAEDVRPDAGFW